MALRSSNGLGRLLGRQGHAGAEALLGGGQIAGGGGQIAQDAEQLGFGVRYSDTMLRK